MLSVSDNIALSGETIVNQPPIVSVVDDNEPVRSGIASLLRSCGYHTTEFESAESFLDDAGLRNTDCLVTDIRLEGMSGVDLYTQLNVMRCHIPTIFITSFADARLRESVLRDGAAGFFTKPVAGSQLINCIERALGERGMT